MATENMIKAGRAGLTFGGDWDETVEYNRLVGVRYDNKLFFSKKPVPIGTIPEDGEYWFLAYEGLTDEQWEALLNGTIQVGDSAKLGGKGASEYALEEELTKRKLDYKVFSTVEDIDNAYNAFHDNARDGEFYEARIGHGVQHPVLGGGTYQVSGCRLSGVYGFQIITTYSGAGGITQFNRRLNNGVWGGWTGYLPLSGGTMKGRIDFESVNNGRGSVFKHHTDTKDYGTRIEDVSKDGASAYFRVMAAQQTIEFAGSDGASKTVLHTGNKPTGTYTGNGDTTAREIKTGGIGSVCVITSNKGIALLTEVGFNSAPNPSGTNSTYETGATFNSGTIYTATTHDLINAAGVAYKYFVL